MSSVDMLAFHQGLTILKCILEENIRISTIA